MGRPTKPDDEKRTERLAGLRVTTAERHDIERRAASAGLDVSDFMRQAVFAQQITPRRPAGDGHLLFELNRVGVNLNQIARAVNRGRPVGDDARHVLALLYQVIDKVGRAHGA